MAPGYKLYINRGFCSTTLVSVVLAQAHPKYRIYILYTKATIFNNLLFNAIWLVLDKSVGYFRYHPAPCK